MHELFQPPIWHTLDLQNYTNVVVGEHGIQIWNIQSHDCCVVSFVIFIWCFYPHKCKFLIVYGQVACPDVLKC